MPMRPNHKSRLWWCVLFTIGITTAVLLVLFALRQNVDLYYTPHELMQAHLSADQTVRLGGIVVKGSVHYAAQGFVEFQLSDQRQCLPVRYHGLLPTLFREGQGVVTHGHLDSRQIFIADEVLAKHDANYSPVKLAAHSSQSHVR